MIPRSVYLASAVIAFALALVACSSGESQAVEFTHPQGEGARPFTASGVAVDQGTVCANGTQSMLRLETVEGQIIAESDWADMFDSALATETVAEMMNYQEWSCTDGSGAFTIEFRNRFDFSTFEFEGQQDVGTWKVIEGTGSYADLDGSGDAVLDLANGAITFRGETKSG